MAFIYGPWSNSIRIEIPTALSSSSISLSNDQIGNCLNPLDPCDQNAEFTIFPVLNITKSLCDNLGGRFEIGEYPLPICYLDPSSSSSRSSSSRSSSSRSSSSRSSSSRSSSLVSSSSVSSSSVSSSLVSSSSNSFTDIFIPPTRSSSSRSSSSRSSSSVSLSCACDPNVTITSDGCDPCCGITQPESGPQFEAITTADGTKICCDPCPNGLYRNANQENCECISSSTINLEESICEMSLNASSEESCRSGCANSLNDFGIRFNMVAEEVKCGNGLSQPRKSIKFDSRIKFYADNLNNYGGCGNVFDGSKDYNEQIYFKGYEAVPCDLEKVLPYSKYPRMQNTLSEWVRQPYDQGGIGQMYRLAGCKKISNIHNVNSSSCLEQFRDNGNLDLSASMDIVSLNPWVVFFPFISVHLDSPDGEIIHEKGWIRKGSFAYQYDWDGGAVNRYTRDSPSNYEIISWIEPINFCNTRDTGKEFHVAINTNTYITKPFDGKNCDDPRKIFIKIKLKVANINLDVSDKIVSLHNSDLGAYLARANTNVEKTWEQLVDSEIPDFIHELQSPTNLNDCCGSSSSSISSSSRSSSSVSSSLVSSSSRSSSSDPCPFVINSALLGGGCKDNVCVPGTPLAYGGICQLYDWLVRSSCIERFFKFDNFKLKGLACKRHGDDRCCKEGCLFASISYDVEPIEFGAPAGGGRGWTVMDVYDYVYTNCDTIAWDRIDSRASLNHKTCGQLKSELYQKFQNLKVKIVDLHMAIGEGIGDQKLDDIDTTFIPLNNKVSRSVIIDLRGKANKMNICGSPTDASLTLESGDGYKFFTIAIAGTQTSDCDCPSCCKDNDGFLTGLQSCSSSSSSSSPSCKPIILNCPSFTYKVCPQTLVKRCSDLDSPPCYCRLCPPYPTQCPSGYRLMTVGQDSNGCTIRVCKPDPNYCPAGYTLKILTDSNGNTIKYCSSYGIYFGTKTKILNILNKKYHNQE